MQTVLFAPTAARAASVDISSQCRCHGHLMISVATRRGRLNARFMSICCRAILGSDDDVWVLKTRR